MLKQNEKIEEIKFPNLIKCSKIMIFHIKFNLNREFSYFIYLVI